MIPVWVQALLVILVGISAVATASVALVGVNLRTRDRGALWAAAASLALVLFGIIIYSLVGQ